MKKISLLSLIAITSINVVEADNMKYINQYTYWFDNEGFEAHQFDNKLAVGLFNIHHTFYEGQEKVKTYSYNRATISTYLTGDNWSFVFGPGIIASSTGQTNPAYTSTIDFQPNRYSNIEFNAERSPLIAGGQQQVTEIADYVSDNLSLTVDYEITDKLFVAVGGYTLLISDGNKNSGIIGKINYQINDNWGIQYRTKTAFYDYNSREYFSPDEYMRHHVLATFGTGLFNDNVLFKVAAGPGITKINERSEVTWMAEGKLSGNIYKDVKLEATANCMSSTFNYQLCYVGSQINVKF
jgi:hypothetical protein